VEEDASGDEVGGVAIDCKAHREALQLRNHGAGKDQVDLIEARGCA